MREFFRCVAEAVMENGLKGLADMVVPGGKFAFDVAESAWKKLKENKRERKLHDEVVQLAQAKFDDARAEAVRVAREVFARVPAGVATPELTSDDIITLELYLTAIPEAVRQSLKRPEDPTGTTVPVTFAVNSADDVLKLLPARPPRFRPAAALPGKPGWVLDRLLGTGGFGEVWFARHTRMGSLSGAVKFCFGQSGRDLIHEADLIDRVMSAGRHPNIVPLLDAHLDVACLWLLFEYVDGGTLTDRIHRLAGMPKEQRLKQVSAALKQLCEAVGFFHALPVPIVHRDLKPSNILLDKDGRLRITDFGIGAVTARETNRTEGRGHGTRGGRLLTYLRGSHTPLYSSPQQRSGDDPDPRDDVHALGVIAYQMMTGHLAQGAGPDFADDLRDNGASEELIALLGKCVAQKSDRRPKDAKMVLELLSSPSAGEGLGVRGSDSSPSPTRGEVLPAVPLLAAPPARKAGDKFVLSFPGVTMTFAWCPPGAFLMGSPDSEHDRGWGEEAHEVRLTKGFFAGVHPVTQAQWKAVMGTNPSHFKGDTLPVESVSWDDAVAFCERVKGKTGRAVRLPTEAEWEYAARGGTTTPFYWGGVLDGTQANCDAAGLGNTSAVGRYATKFPHPWGLTDVLGNVREWCADFHDAEALVRSPASNPGDHNGEQKLRAQRGGSWLTAAKFCRAASRFWAERGHRDITCGFRVVFNPD